MSSVLTSIYGLALQADFPFTIPLPSTHETPSLRITPFTGQVRSPNWNAPAYESVFQTRDGRRYLRICPLDQAGKIALRMIEGVDYYLLPDAIYYDRWAEIYDAHLEVTLLGTALPIWMNLRGIPAMHASAVRVGDSAVAFLADNLAGKSTLTAMFVKDGFPLLSDDVVALEWRGTSLFARPGYPQIRMWPGTAQFALGHYEDLAPIVPGVQKRRVPVGTGLFGTMHNAPLPLHAVYVPERHEPSGDPQADTTTGITIEALAPAEAAITLLRRTLHARVAEHLGMRQQRLEFFARMAGQIPVRRLRYPTGFEYLPAVKEALLRDLALCAPAAGA